MCRSRKEVEWRWGIMAIKYLAGNRIIGTAAERLALQSEVAANASNTATYDWNLNSGAPTGWTARNESGSDWAFANNRLDFKNNILANGSGADFDLGTGFATTATWIFRYSVYMESGDHAYGSAGQGDAVTLLGIQSHDSTAANTASAPSSTHQNDYSESHESICPRVTSGGTTTSNYKIQYAIEEGLNNCTNQTGGSDDSDKESGNITSIDVDTTYYIEIKKTAASTFKIGVYNNADYDSGNLVGSEVTAVYGGSFTELRYIHFEAHNQDQTYHSDHGGYIDDMKFWLPTTLYPNLAPGSIYEESDTGKHYVFNATTGWNEVVEE